MPDPTRVLVLGGGRVGSAIASDLALEPDLAVTVLDRDPRRAAAIPADSPARFETADLSRTEEVRARAAAADLVVGAVPGWMGYRTLEAVIEAGRDVVDISFFEQDPFGLDALAKERGVTAVVDCGVAPGLSNLVAGRVEHEFQRADSFRCLVGGIPERPEPPWEYKAPYSPSDVLEMYTRPARLRRRGEALSLPALSEPEELDFPGVGRLEAFLTDGLRTLLSTSAIPDLEEKTLRYPGHREKIALLAESGFFDEERTVEGRRLRPREVTSALLFEAWRQGPGDHDITAMRLVAEGVLDGRPLRRTWDLCDRFDRERGISSMARTTAYPATAVARRLARGELARPGICPPEYLGADRGLYEALLADLAERGVRFAVTDEPL